MNRSPEEMKLLEEKIARIRKNNEAIIRKKRQIIEEEIRQAKLSNAIVDPNKPYSDKLDEAPTLYSDSVEEKKIQKPTNIVYPKMSQEDKRFASRNRNEDEAWRKERKQIDSERIRRQKAASGWKREWDAHKIVEDNENTSWQNKDNRFSSGQRNNNNEAIEYNSRSNHQNVTAEKFDSCRSDRLMNSKKISNNLQTKTHYEERRESEPTCRLLTKPAKSFSYCGDVSVQSTDTLTNWHNSELPSKHTDVKSLRRREANHVVTKDEKKVVKKVDHHQNKFDSNQSNNNSNKPCITLGPLRNINTRNDDKIITNLTCKVSKYSDTKTQSATTNSRDECDLNKQNLNERLKNIVISVKTGVNEPSERVVEVVKEQKGYDSKVSSTDLTVAYERTGAQCNISSESRLLPQPTRYSLIQKRSNISSLPSTNTSGLIRPNELVLQKNDVKSKSDPVDIFRNHSNASFPQCSNSQSKLKENTLSKKVTLQPSGGDDEDDEDSQWEDISDEEWEDISEEEIE